jgi:hypothetical protein
MNYVCNSQTGKRLMAKCRMLLQENEELGRTVSSGRLAKLEGDIALQKKLILEMKNSEKGKKVSSCNVEEQICKSFISEEITVNS